MRHNSWLVCTVGNTYVYIDKTFAFYGNADSLFFNPFYSLVGYLNMTV